MNMFQYWKKKLFPSGQAPSQLPVSLEAMSDDQLESHIDRERYGEFFLTDAVRPSASLAIVPECGYRHKVYEGEQGRVPLLQASVSREDLFDTFLDLLGCLGTEEDLHVVLESSHHRQVGWVYQEDHLRDWKRLGIELTILKSVLVDFEDLLLNDGCTGIAVYSEELEREVQFDEHKLLSTFAADLRDFERVFALHEVPCKEELRLITEDEHVHASTDAFRERFEEFKEAMGIFA